MSISNYYENVLLDELDGLTVYVQLHTGAPGEDCTSNVATESTRKLVTFSAAASGEKVSSNTQGWTSLPASETITHLTLWDATSSGNALYWAALENSLDIVSGGSLTINTGSLKVRLD